MDHSPILSFDFGGTKLAAGLVAAVDGQVFAATRCATPNDAAASYTAMLAMARELLAQTATPPVAIGVSFGGPVERDGRTVRRSMHVPGWKQASLAGQLENEFGLPCAVANDADAAALAEQRYGAGRGASHLLYMTVSTGIGGGIVIDGQVYRGARAWAGEVGHQVLDPAGPACYCGRNGCLEALASGRAIAQAAQQAISHHPESVLAALLPDMITAQDVAEAVPHDQLAREVWNTAMAWLGIGVANAANLLNPTRVVLGGGLTRAGALLFDPVRQVVAQRVLDPDLDVVPTALGDHVGLLGGAAVAPQDLV